MNSTNFFMILINYLKAKDTPFKTKDKVCQLVLYVTAERQSPKTKYCYKHWVCKAIFSVQASRGLSATGELIFWKSNVLQLVLVLVILSASSLLLTRLFYRLRVQKCIAEFWDENVSTWVLWLLLLRWPTSDNLSTQFNRTATTSQQYHDNFKLVLSLWYCCDVVLLRCGIESRVAHRMLIALSESRRVERKTGLMTISRWISVMNSWFNDCLV